MNLENTETVRQTGNRTKRHVNAAKKHKTKKLLPLQD